MLNSFIIIYLDNILIYITKKLNIFIIIYLDDILIYINNIDPNYIKVI